MYILPIFVYFVTALEFLLGPAIAFPKM